MFLGKGGHHLDQSFLPFVSHHGLGWGGHTRGKEGDEVLTTFSHHDVAGQFLATGSLARGEVTVAVHDALFREMAEPVERFTVPELRVGQLAEGLDGEVLINVRGFEFTAQGGAEAGARCLPPTKAPRSLAAVDVLVDDVSAESRFLQTVQTSEVNWSLFGRRTVLALAPPGNARFQARAFECIGAEDDIQGVYARFGEELAKGVREEPDERRDLAVQGDSNAHSIASVFSMCPSGSRNDAEIRTAGSGRRSLRSIQPLVAICRPSRVAGRCPAVSWR